MPLAAEESKQAIGPETESVDQAPRESRSAESQSVELNFSGADGNASLSPDFLKTSCNQETPVSNSRCVSSRHRLRDPHLPNRKASTSHRLVANETASAPEM